MDKKEVALLLIKLKAYFVGKLEKDPRAKIEVAQTFIELQDLNKQLE